MTTHSDQPTDATTHRGERYWREGFVAPIRVVDAAQALRHRRRMESAESQVGAFHY